MARMAACSPHSPRLKDRARCLAASRHMRRYAYVPGADTIPGLGCLANMPHRPHLWRAALPTCPVGLT
eukprot:scaffold151817_cov24-Tisochrysis_lutea.AAC.1